MLNNIFNIIVIFVVGISFSSCDSLKKNNSKNQSPNTTISGKNKKISFSEDVIELSDIIPLADGGAYAQGLDRIWYLKGNVAIVVSEKDTNLQIPPDSLKTSTEKYLWARLQIEKRKRIKCEEGKQDNIDHTE